MFTCSAVPCESWVVSCNLWARDPPRHLLVAPQRAPGPELTFSLMHSRTQIQTRQGVCVSSMCRQRQRAAMALFRSQACLDTKYFPKFYYAKRRFPVTSKYRHIHGVLNIDKIKKKLHSFVVLCETNVLSLISHFFG
jgi:hypothetical protein